MPGRQYEPPPRVLASAWSVGWGWGTRPVGNPGGCRDTLLGPEESGPARDVSGSCAGQALWSGSCGCRGGRVVGVGDSGWFGLHVPARSYGRVRVVGCRLCFENFTVDASIFVAQVFKGTRWMPWHQEPKKDVGICDKPRVVDNQTVIRGFPNGETRLEASPVTRT